MQLQDRCAHEENQLRLEKRLHARAQETITALEAKIKSERERNHKEKEEHRAQRLHEFEEAQVIPPGHTRTHIGRGGKVLMFVCRRGCEWNGTR